MVDVVPSARPLQEFHFIAELRRCFTKRADMVLRGIGDDAAVIRPAPGRVLLLTTDLLAEHVHFDLASASFEDVGYKAAVANLSDIAAMGGRPEHVLVAVAAPPSCSAWAIGCLYRGLMQACKPYRVNLIGGDTSASRDGLFLGITMTGSAPPAHVLGRDGARPGDLVYVTGPLGDSLAGLNLLSRRGRVRTKRGVRHNSRDARYLIARHLRPAPRIAEGLLLSERGLATAAIDLSDGLSGDLRHVCEQSGVGAEIDETAVPLSPACRRYAAAYRTDPLALALRGGEDYELLFTVPPTKVDELERVMSRSGHQVTRIGTILPKASGVRLRAGDGSLRRMPEISYQHFTPTTQRPVTTWSH